VNLAVLRLYQLQPSSAKKELIAKILLKALMQLPYADYKICVQVLPERLQVGRKQINTGQMHQLSWLCSMGVWALASPVPNYAQKHGRTSALLVFPMPPSIHTSWDVRVWYIA